MRTTFHTALHGVMEIRFVSASKQQGVNPCSVFNGYCSHLCLYLGGVNYACACPDEPDSTPCSLEPMMKVLLPHSELDADDESLTPTSETLPPKLENTFTLVFLGAGSLFVIAIIAAVIFFLCVNPKHKRRSDKYLYESEPKVLTFSNPNYSTSSTEQVPHSDKRTFWGKFKYDKSQERVYDVHSESDKQTASPEVVSLIPAPPSPTHCAVDHHPTPLDNTL